MKKTGTEQFIPQIKSGFIKTMKEKYNVLEEESGQIVESFITVIEDASSYLFSLNHSLPYSYIGYICGYLRYYYPLEFITTTLNINQNDTEKTNKAIEYAKKHNIKINSPRFRYSKAEYFMDKENNVIYKGIASIKYMNENIANEMYALRDNKYNSFIDLLIDLKDKTSMNTRQLYILIVTDFFEEFGKSQKLLDIVDIYNNILSKKLKSSRGEVSFNKVSLEYPKELIEKYATDKSKEERYKQYKVQNAEGLCNELIEQLPNVEMSSIEKIKTSLEMLGDCSYHFEDYSPSVCIVVDIDTKFKNKKCHLFNIASGNIAEIKIGEGWYEVNPIKQYDVIEIYQMNRKPKKEQVEVEEVDKKGNIVKKKRWRNTDNVELWLSEYIVLSEQDIEELNKEEREYRLELVDTI